MATITARRSRDGGVASVRLASAGRASPSSATEAGSDRVRAGGAERTRLASAALGEVQANRIAAVVGSAVTVALATALIAPLDRLMPLRSVAVIDVVAALSASVLWGLPFGLAVSLAGVLAFNFFYLP